MRVFVAGGTGAIGRHLIPALIADGHQVTASARSAAKSAELAAAGAVPVVMDGLDRDAVLAAVQEAGPNAGQDRGPPPQSRPAGLGPANAGGDPACR
jgi:2-alkyl-3-oxoalkanoate reductase